MDKRVANADAAIEKLFDGATILIGGFGTCGNPENLIAAVIRKGTKNLTCVSNNAGMADFGLGLLVTARRVRKMICSFPGQNKFAEQQVLNGEIEIELNPQGTLVERMRAGGAGIPAFYTPTGVGTVMAEGKEVREFNGKKYLLEPCPARRFCFHQGVERRPLGKPCLSKDRAEFQSRDGDGGGLRDRGSGRVGRAGVSWIPMAFIRREFSSTLFFRERSYVKDDRKDGRAQARVTLSRTVEGRRWQNRRWHKQKDIKEKIARRVAQEMRDGYYANLGVGIPVMVANYIPEGMEVVLEAENGMLGIGPSPFEDQVDPDLINAGKEPCDRDSWDLAIFQAQTRLP